MHLAIMLSLWHIKDCALAALPGHQMQACLWIRHQKSAQSAHPIWLVTVPASNALQLISARQKKLTDPMGRLLVGMAVQRQQH